MRSRRSRAAARVTQPRSAATISAMTPKPEPPIVTAIRVARALAGRAPVEGETADGMRAFPEIAERLPLHDLEQRVVRQRRELRRIVVAAAVPRRTFAAGRHSVVNGCVAADLAAPGQLRLRQLTSCLRARLLRRLRFSR